MLLIISTACAFLIFLDYHKSKNIQKSIIYVAVLVAMIALLGLAVKVLQFKLLYLVVLIPLVLFGMLFLKNSRKDEVDF